MACWHAIPTVRLPEHLLLAWSICSAHNYNFAGLNDLLLDRGISCVHIVGLALDVCVLWTALDAVNLGFDVTVFPNATVAMDSNAERIAQDALVKAGIKLCDWTCD
eukprot:1155016-Pelagomonas_calceolata.AAC.2